MAIVIPRVPNRGQLALKALAERIYHLIQDCQWPMHVGSVPLEKIYDNW
jgi:hypothetical protein